MHTKREGQNQSILVVSDLHIGFAHWFQSQNVSIDWYQIAEKTEKELEKIVTSCKANSIVLLGDIKNNVSGINKGDWKVVLNFCSPSHRYVKSILFLVIMTVKSGYSCLTQLSTDRGNRNDNR